MAITFSEAGIRNTVTAVTNSVTPTVAAVTDGAALVWVENATAGVDPTSVTFAGVSLTKLHSVTVTTRLTQASLWGGNIGTLTTASRTVAATFAISSSSSVTWATYSGVKQSAAPASWQQSTNTGTSTSDITTSLTPAVANSWLVMFSIDLATSRTPVAGTTVRYNGSNWQTADSNGPLALSPQTLAYTLSPSAVFGNNAAILQEAVASSSSNSGFFNFM